MSTSPSRRQKGLALPSPENSLGEPSNQDTDFQVIHAAVTLAVPPVFAANLRAGVEEMLDSMVMRYNPSLQGIVLSHANVTFADNVARIQYDCPFLICNVKFDATVWSPRIGYKLSGKLNLCSPDHISLLVHRTFNVSIPRHHIPTETWEFEYGPAEFASKGEEPDDDGDGGVIDHNPGGRWIHRVSGETLGGGKGLLGFTVIGLTVANEMLSLLGSLQPDPFSPRHVVMQSDSAIKADVDSNGESENESSESEEGSNDGPDGAAVYRPAKRRADEDDEVPSATKRKR